MDRLWNTLTTLTLAAAALVSIGYVVIFVSPSVSPFGPKPEPTLIGLINTPTPKNTAIPPTATSVPTWTPEASPTTGPTGPTRTPRPTNTSRPTVYFTPRPTKTGSPTPTIHPFPFQLVEDGVRFESYPFVSGCAWLGMGGEVLDREGEPIPGVSVVLNGGGLQNIVTQSGNQSGFGESGWEHFVDNKVKEGDFTIQLWHRWYASETDNRPASEVVHVHTTKDCRSNMAYIVFEVAWDDYVAP